MAVDDRSREIEPVPVLTRPSGPSPEHDPRVRYVTAGRVAYLTLSRPDVLNAMDLRAHEELSAALDRFERDDQVWVAVLTGAGDRAFCVGQDLKELARRNATGTPASTFGSRGLPGYPRLTERFDLAKPIIARVNGYAFGGGFELALACDIIVASTTAQFALTEARLGLVPGAGGVFRLTRQLPYRQALGHLLTGRRLAADRALAFGLVNDVVPPDELDKCVAGWVDDILACAPLSVRAIKQAAQQSSTMPLAQAFATRFPWEELRARSDDAREGPAAFAEKRSPRWTAS